jgi:hypothetical protein
MHGACGVIDTACMVHVVSLTPHAQKFFEQLRKVKIICKTAMVCKKINNACGIIDTACTVHAVSLTLHANITPHAPSMNDSYGPGSLLREYLSKT